ncbi:MAG: CPBP family intramembrane metalloprotease [Bacteroidetes bacterium]|jgi:hypothetical protein|nr:CPBP family intramembrane metalloprotease [Bacteroidota bacterium]
MEYRSVKGYTGAAQLGFLFVFLGVGFICAGMVQALIGFKMVPAGTSFEQLPDAMLKAMKDPKYVSYARLSQVLGTFFLMCIPAVICSWIAYGRNKFWLGFNRYINPYQLMIGFLIIFTANIMASSLDEVSRAAISHFPSLNTTAKQLEDVYNEQVLAISNLQSWPEFFMALAIMAFFPALFEELFFRGTVQQLFVRWWKRPLIAIIVTSLLFSLIHGSIYLFISRAILGFVLGLMFYTTKNIWVNVIAHFLNNALALVQLFSMSRSKHAVDVNNIDPKLEWWFGIIAVFALFFLFRFLQRYSVQNVYRINAKEQLLIAETNAYPFAHKETNDLGNQQTNA